MTKKHYEALARVFREVRNQPLGEDGKSSPYSQLLDKITDILAADNPRFQRSRFMDACRGEDSKDSAGRTVRYSSSARNDAAKAAKSVS